MSQGKAIEMGLSIITVHLNDFEGLQRTLVSMAGLVSWKQLQWIVIDGGSEVRQAGEEGVLQQVRELADSFVSEPDEGIYDAMNTGTALAKGDYVLYLNAGDELHPQFDFEALVAALGDARPAMIWGTCHERFDNDELVKVKNRSPSLAWYGMPVNHQNVLFRRDLLGEAPYDLQYQICADYDLVGRILKQGGDVFRTYIPVAIFRRGGRNEQRFALTMSEETNLRTLHFGVPGVASQAIRYVKSFNARLSRVPALRRLLRRWV